MFILKTQLNQDDEFFEGTMYEKDKVTDLDRSRVKRWFIKGCNGHADCVQVQPELQEMIVFKRLNLMEVWPIKGTFDILFCRNVVIYFDKPTQRILFERFCKHLTPNAHMFIGHSESLFKITDRFQLLGNTIYRRIK